MRHLKTFKIFESEIVYGKMTPEMNKLADSMMVDIDVTVETDRDKMSEWVVEQGLQRVVDLYLDSDEFREFTETSVKETDKYRERVMSGEDPEEVLEEMTQKAIDDQTYWNEFIEENSYDSSEMDEIQGDIKYLSSDKNSSTFRLEFESTWSEVPGSLLPTIDVYGSMTIHKYREPFLPFRIRSVNYHDPEIKDLNSEFQTSHPNTMTGELSIYDTDLIALDKGPIEVKSFYCNDNLRLISLEGLGEYDEFYLEGEYGLPKEVLERSINLTPGTTESVEYYISLLSMKEFENFDTEQVEFVLERIGHFSGIQKYIDENPEKMAILLKPVWKKIKSMDQFKDLKFPEKLSGEMDLMSDLHDIGL